MTTTECSNAKVGARASLYSYNDPTCPLSSVNFLNLDNLRLKFVTDGANVLPTEYQQMVKAYDFHASLYCDLGANTLILAFRGSASLTQLDQNDLSDWYDTNFLQHLGARPLQYSAAADTAELIQRHLADYDNVCGSEAPRFILAGHSKGGGQAQYAAIRRELEAIVFNADLVNPIIFDDWMLYPPALLAPIYSYLRAFRSTLSCAVGQSDIDVQLLIAYFGTGRIKDIRMVNDPLTKTLFDVCRGNAPHAPINWLVNTLSCSSGGHSIETVVHELKACAP
jgi:hypothetical protein